MKPIYAYAADNGDGKSTWPECWGQCSDFAARILALGSTPEEAAASGKKAFPSAFSAGVWRRSSARAKGARRLSGVAGGWWVRD